MNEAERHLSKTDQVMSRLVSDYGRCHFLEGGYKPFDTLARFIIGQQLSAKVAETIFHRVSRIVPTPFSPSNLLSVPIEDLKTAGVSSRKIKYLIELGENAISTRLNFDVLLDRSNDEVIQTLVAFQGIGRWTAEMFLIFGLHRSDVLALGDAGLKRAVRILYSENTELEKISEIWRPYRSVASWYLWKFLDS